jgi:hypothetical protein
MSKDKSRRSVMKRQIMVVICSLALLVAAGACKKKQEQPVPQTNMPGQQMPAGQPGQPGQPGMPPGQPGMQPGQNIVMPKGETKIVVPDSVKGQWKSVIILVESKKTKKTAEYTVNVNSDFKIPNSNLKITVGEFLPDFRMNGLEMTSSSNEMNNPAVGVRIYDGSKQVFPAAYKKWGWLYSKFPTMHPFEHPDYSIVLKSGVKKG